MGCGASSSSVPGAPSKKKGLAAAWEKAKTGTGFGAIPDQYATFQEVSSALRKAGLESSQLVVGVDFTKSNTWTGERSFQGRCLHSLETGSNPYFEVLTSVAKVLKDFDDDNLIPAYGFGDARTKNRAVFSFRPNDEPCDGLEECLARYAAIAQTADLAGPTNFGPLIRQAIDLVRNTGEYHILVMVADGQVDQKKDTADAIVEASNYPLSIVMIGVGDGPWDLMEEFDDELPARKFDNFQFVNYEEMKRKYPREKLDTAFAVHALMEVPDQYSAVKNLGLLRDDENMNHDQGPWRRHWSAEHGRPYWWNRITEESVWHPPAQSPPPLVKGLGLSVPYRAPARPLPPPPKSLEVEALTFSAGMSPTLLKTMRPQHQQQHQQQHQAHFQHPAHHHFQQKRQSQCRPYEPEQE